MEKCALSGAGFARSSTWDNTDCIVSKVRGPQIPTFLLRINAASSTESGSGTDQVSSRSQLSMKRQIIAAAT